MKVFIFTLGCKVNQYESQAILENFIKNGFEKTNDLKESDIIIVNSCTVTAESDKKVRKILHKVKKGNPKSIVVLTGCMPQAFPEKVSAWPEADIIVGNANKTNIIGAVKKFINSQEKISRIENFLNTYDDFKIENFNDRTRAFVKIEDGCNRFCSYCIIPYSRGRVRSKSLESLKDEIENLAKNGYQEIVLVGINLSCYGQDIGKNLCDAIEVVASVEKIKRVRLGSLEPEQMDEHFIRRLAKIEKLCPQFHLSLQSGCDETLKRMNRHYTTKEYEIIVQNLRSSFENASITTDVMVGFSGESDEEFLKSINFIKKIRFAKIHVFPYSVRPGTSAEKFKNQISPQVKNSRTKIMLALAEKLNSEFLVSQVNKTEEVLFERPIGEFIEGYSKNYTPVLVKSDENLLGKIYNVKITSVKNNHCFGIVL